MEAEEQRKEARMSYDDVASKMLNFLLQYHGDERDIRGIAVRQPRAANPIPRTEASRPSCGNYQEQEA
eukprot:2471731-Amphidinium_carterae.1